MVANGYSDALHPEERTTMAERTTSNDPSVAPSPEPMGARPGLSLDELSLLEEFVAIIAHELSTPLAIIRAAADLALADATEKDDTRGSDEQLRLLAIIQRNTDLASLLLTRLSLARDVEADAVQLTLGDVDLGRLVRDSVDDLSHVILGDHRVEVLVLQPALIRADATAVREIVFNLLSNAAKYSDAGARIEVTIDVAATTAHVVVRNHGSGVTPGDTEAIFDKFTQEDERSSGAGLGLFISRGLARAHGGDIVVQPATDVGSVFELTLPIAA
jgi:signal transduction histidine kinase